MDLKLPPEFVNTPAYDVFNVDLPDSVYRTLAVLHGLAWQTKGERTPPTTVLELATLRGLQERQMYNHLRKLKEMRRIRVNNLGRGRIVIYPLRWEPGAALPMDEKSSLTEVEIAQLTDEDGPPGEVTAKNCSSAAKNCSKHVVDSSLNNSDSDSESQSKQQHDQHGTAKNCSDLIQAMANIFIEDGAAPDVAQSKAGDLIEKYGLKRCQRQLSYFPRRCELARASAEGLRNPSGLFIRSVQHNWQPPPQTRKNSSKTWYSEEEFNRLIQH